MMVIFTNKTATIGAVDKLESVRPAGTTWCNRCGKAKQIFEILNLELLDDNQIYIHYVPKEMAKK